MAFKRSTVRSRLSPPSVLKLQWFQDIFLARLRAEISINVELCEVYIKVNMDVIVRVLAW